MFYCYCKLFSSACALASRSFSNWPNIYTRLNDEQENSPKYLQTMLNCSELQQRIFVEKNIDEIKKLIRLKANRWSNIFKRLVAAVRFLAERNLPFRLSQAIMFIFLFNPKLVELKLEQNFKRLCCS